MNKIYETLQRLKSLLTLKVITKEEYYRELDELIRYAKNKEEIKAINSYKYDE